MKNVLRGLARRQDGVVATWQLRDAGLSPKAIEHRTGLLQRLHDGVHLTGEAEPTRRQLWWAATLTSPTSVLSHASAGAAWGFRPWQAGFEVVTRPGTGGPKMHGPLLVCHSNHIDHTELHGLRITTPERTVADLWPTQSPSQQRKMLREALRLKTTTIPRLEQHLAHAPPRLRPRSLTRCCQRYERLQLHRCRSDAEAYAVELIDEMKLQLPAINVKRAGLEADLSWPQHHLILEIDGDRFHQDKAEDARRTKAWKAAGWQVERATSDDVFDDPAPSSSACASC